MNKTAKKVLVASAIIIGIGVATAGIMTFLMNKEMKRFSVLETAQILPSVYAVNAGMANLFLIPDINDTYISIDAGTDVKQVAEELSILGIDPKMITTVLCTHSDYDHIGGISVYPNAKIILSEKEKQMIDGTTTRFIGMIKNSIELPYQTIENSREFTVGSHRVTGLLTPGHTPGSTCWQIDDTLLFTGDAFGIENGKAGLFSRLFNMDTEQQISSIINVATLSGLKNVFTGHHGWSVNITWLFN